MLFAPFVPFEFFVFCFFLYPSFNISFFFSLFSFFSVPKAVAMRSLCCGTSFKIDPPLRRMCNSQLEINSKR